MKHRHDFKPYEDLVTREEVGDKVKVTRIEQEKCECGVIWKNPIHLSVAKRDECLNGFFGVTWEEL